MPIVDWTHGWRHLAALLERERGRWVLWLPVLLGIGVATFFALPGAPPQVTAWAAAGLALALLVLARRRPLQPVAPGEALAIGLAAALAGAALAQTRLREVAAPVVERAAAYRVEARIADLAPLPAGAQLLLDQVRLERVPPERTPLVIRVNLRGQVGDLRPGDRIRLLARLQPPMPPALPGGFDFARQAYFERLGALGFAMGKAQLVARDEDRLSLVIAQLRTTIAARIMESSPGAAGATAAALIAGVRAGIDQETWRAMQASGLAHLISVSGLHMVLVAGSVFTACRWLLALIPPLALRFPVKRIAAGVALPAAAFYLMLSGASVPTQRAFLMTAVGLIAVMADRNPFSIRLLAWSALAVLLVRPESVLGASFQLSFAAVLALIVVYEAWQRREPDPDAPRSARAGVWRYFLGVCATTLIASSATTPFAAFHFQTIPTYGIIANLIAVPLTSFLVMPAGLLGLLLLPLGLDQPAFELMALGVEGVLLTARVVAGLPGALLLVEQWPMAALLALAMGGLWLALWHQPWRWLGLGPAAAAVGLVLLARSPDLVVAAGLGQVAVRHPDGSVTLIEWDRNRMVRETWLRHLGVAAAAKPPRPGAGAQNDVACDPFGCLVRLGERRVALARHPGAVLVDCASADLVLARVGPERCPDDTPILGTRALAESGGLTVRLEAGDLEVETVAERRGNWPWTSR